jgi:hypothetical protein
VLVIDMSDPAMQEALADCEVGVAKTLTLTVTPLAKEGALVAKVDSVEYSEKAEATPKPRSGSKPYRPKAPAPEEAY